MKIRVKDTNVYSKIPGILFIVFFGVSSMGILAGSKQKFRGHYCLNDVSVIFNELGIVSIFCAIFICISIFLLIYLLKTPRRYVGRIVEILDSTNPMQKILEINIKDGKNIIPCDCYIDANEEFKKGQKVYAYVKEFNWQIKYLRRIDEQLETIIFRKKQLKIIGLLVFVYILLRIIVLGG